MERARQVLACVYVWARHVWFFKGVVEWVSSASIWVKLGAIMSGLTPIALGYLSKLPLPMIIVLVLVAMAATLVVIEKMMGLAERRRKQKALGRSPIQASLHPLVGKIEPRGYLQIAPLHNPYADGSNTSAGITIEVALQNQTQSLARVDEASLEVVLPEDNLFTLACAARYPSHRRDRTGLGGFPANCSDLPLDIMPVTSAKDTANQWDFCFAGPVFIQPRHRFATNSVQGTLGIVFLGHERSRFEWPLDLGVHWG